MTDARRALCKRCRGHRDELGLLSWRGYCGDCGKFLAHEAADALHYKTGEKWGKWRRSMAACVGGILLDEPPPRP